jgi:hypothetical protein
MSYKFLPLCRNRRFSPTLAGRILWLSRQSSVFHGQKSLRRNLTAQTQITRTTDIARYWLVSPVFTMQSTMLAHRTIVNRNTYEYGTASNEADLSRGGFEALPAMT